LRGLELAAREDLLRLGRLGAAGRRAHERVAQDGRGGFPALRGLEHAPPDGLDRGVCLAGSAD
jgi:hypothetical protein